MNSIDFFARFIQIVDVFVIPVSTALAAWLVFRLRSITKTVNTTKTEMTKVREQSTEIHEQTVNDHGNKINMRDQTDSIENKIDWLVSSVFWLYKKAENNSERIDEIEDVTLPGLPMSRKQYRLSMTAPTAPTFLKEKRK